LVLSEQDALPPRLFLSVFIHPLLSNLSPLIAPQRHTQQDQVFSFLKSNRRPLAPFSTSVFRPPPISPRGTTIPFLPFFKPLSSPLSFRCHGGRVFFEENSRPGPGLGVYFLPPLHPTSVSFLPPFSPPLRGIDPTGASVSLPRRGPCPLFSPGRHTLPF